MLDERPVLAALEHRLDRDVERVREPPDRGQGRIGLVALDLRDDRFRHARSGREIGQRQAVALAQLLDGEAELVRQRGGAGLEDFRAIFAFHAHGRSPGPNCKADR